MLSGNQKQYLRGLAHHRKPVVTVGAGGITDAVVAELGEALSHHELVKVKLPAADASGKKALVKRIREATRAQWVQTIGRVAVFYRPGPEPKIVLPDN